ncbi:hypothetical protein ACTWPT_35610 [Nonomuraea sp. 3N208]|uniref:hypothetical protein n=1 Tax=Nonomuraea sp. 3N208 TaxID=3457421 RepID=UPI003FD609CB
MLTRRQLGLGALAVGALGFSSSTAHDYASRQTFDHFERVFREAGAPGQPTETNERGRLAWGASYVMFAFTRMYEAYRDTAYLDRFIIDADQVLAGRDSERGFKDYRGLSLPAWQAAGAYTVGFATLTDASGQPLLEVRSALSYADEATATVSAGTSASRFTLEVRNARYGRVATFPDLSLDPASPDYAVKRIHDAYPTPTMVTARDPRPAPAGGTVPVLGETRLSVKPMIFAVHTGMITYPMAAFARIVLHDGHLTKYRGKALEYLQAVKEAVAVHEREWRPDGHLIWVKGMPLPYDGTEQPTNQWLALGLTYAELAAATGDPFYRDRALRMARSFGGELKPDAGDAYVWSYWPSFGKTYNGYTADQNVSEYTPSIAGARQIEDLSHGGIDVEFAALAFRHKIYYRGIDLARIARTYTRNLATTGPDGLPTTNARLDGTGGPLNAEGSLQAGRWMAVAPWDAGVFAHSRSIYDARAVQPAQGAYPASYLANMAYLNWFARRS